jgi:hypothetical protein
MKENEEDVEDKKDSNDKKKCSLFSILASVDAAYVLFAVTALYSLVKWTSVNEQDISKHELRIAAIEKQQKVDDASRQEINKKLDKVLFYIYTGTKPQNTVE